MSTSLAEQLQRLAVPQTSRLERDKKRPSLLFDPKEAANLNKETVYQIGIDGLEELKNRNAVFAQFENTLFHVTSKEFERSVESAESNQRLNKNIRKFLLLLLPYFQFNCSYKALEWLVYRYYIHEYNKEDLLMLILPYHETNIFVRALQLLNLKGTRDKWQWLKPLQRPGIHLPKQTLYNHAASDVYFLEFLSNFVLAIINEHEKPGSLTVVFNFYCTTFTGALEHSKEVGESQVSQMLPVVFKGLTSDIPDFAAATYVVIAKLLTKTQFSDKILEKFVERITQMNVTSLMGEAVLVLIVLYQSQKQYGNISDVAIRNLCDKEGFTKVLEKFNEDGVHIYPLLRLLFTSGICSAVTKEESQLYRTFVDRLFDEVKVDNSFVDMLLKSILEFDCKQHKESVTWLKQFLKKLETRHPVAYDAAVKNIMTTTKDPTQIQRQKNLRQLIQNLTNVLDSYELFEKLYHPSSKLRIEGLRMLYRKLEVFQENERELFRNAVFDRLNDDSLEVVSEVLQLFNKKFPKIVEMDGLKDVLIKLLWKCQSDKEHWWKISYAALKVLCCHFNDSDVKVFLAVLPFLLPISGDELSAAKQIVQSDYAKESRMLKPLRGELTKALSYKDFLNVTYAKLDGNTNLPDVKSLVEALRGMSDRNDAVHKYMAMLLLSSCLPPNSNAEISNLLLDIFEAFLNTSKLTMVKGEADVSDYMTLARKNKFALQSVLHCIKKVILKTEIPSLIGLMDFSSSSTCTSSLFYLRLLKILVKGCCSNKKHKSSAYADALNSYMVFSNNELLQTVHLLLNVSIAENELVDDRFRVDCLKTLTTLLLKKQTDTSKFLQLDQAIVPYILAGFTVPNMEMRKVLLGLTKVLVSTTGRSDNYVGILAKLVRNQEEILLDHEQIPLVIFNTLSTSKSSKDSNLKMILSALISATSNPNYPIYLKSGLMIVLAHITDKEVFMVTSRLAIDVLAKHQGKLVELSMSESDIIAKNLLRFDASIADTLEENSIIWQFLKMSIEDDATVVQNKGHPTCPAILMLNQVDREVFSHLKQPLQVAMLDLLVRLATDSQNPDVLQVVSHVFKTIDLDVSLVVKQLQQMRDVQSPKHDPAKRKRRVDVVPTVDILDTGEWKRGVTVLEFIQNKKKIRNADVLLSVLFEVLKRCLDFDEQASVEYPKQLILTTILHCCIRIKIDDQALPKNAFNMQLVVQCIRASQNPQTHHHALLLLSQAALLIPKQVLHHIIAIFTFVGSSVLRHDDTYSFQIITKIVDSIIPIIIEDGAKESVTTVLRVFVDAILDIPEYRRKPLFKQLLTQLNPKENLHLFLLIVFEAHVVHGHTETQKKASKNRSLLNIDDSPKRLDIAADLCCEFSPDVMIFNCIKILQYLCKLPEDKGEAGGVHGGTFDIARYTPKQFRHYKYTIITFTASFLASTQFINKIAALPDDEMAQLENLFKETIINVLNYIQVTSKVAERHSNTPQAQYWKVILHHSYDTLDAVNALLTNEMFLLVIRGLMVYSLSPVRKRAIELLNNKLQHASFVNDCDKTKLYDLVVSQLITIIRTIDGTDTVEQEQIIQKALVSLKLLVKHLAADNRDKFVQILEFIADLIKSHNGKVHENTLASLILCLAELCSVLRAHAISSLNKFMPVLIKILKTQKRLETPNLLLISDLIAIVKIFDSLPLFLSPYLEKLLYELASLACRWNPSSEDPKLAPFMTKLNNLQQKIGSVIPLRVLLPAIQNSYTSLVEKRNFPAVGPLMSILAESLANLKGADVQGNLPELTGFFLNALQFRAEGRSTHEEANEVEGYVIKTFVKLVLKLSESTFRPLYYRLFDWAVRTDAKSERIITFYNLSHAFAGCLKGLFVLFAGHFVNNSATVLEACNQLKNDELYFEDDTKNIALLENVFKTLHAIFLYDSKKFVTKERFDVLMQPVVDQLENTLGGIDCLEKRAKSILTPCIVQFAMATADDALWKQMNYQILLKTRHNSPNIRLVALDCLSETAKRLGEDFLPLLPETIPFLAELLEDEEESVEKACQKTVQELEKVLGEPLQKYF